MGIGLIAAWLAGGSREDAAKLAGWFTGGLAVSLVALSGLAWALLRGLRALARVWRMPATLRHGIANLYRPGNHAQSALVALGVGVMFTLTIYLVQHSMLVQIAASAPPGRPNVFLINITGAEREPMLAMLAQAPGIEGKPDLRTSVGARLESIDGQPVEKRVAESPGRRYRQSRTVTWLDQPEGTQIVSGAWWQGRPAQPQLSVSEDAAKTLDIKVGARLEWTSHGRTLKVRVAAIHRTEGIRPGSTIDFIFSPGALDGLPMIYFGGVRMKAASIARFQKEAFRRFPAVSVINIADVIDRIQDVVDQIAIVVRFISAFAILAGVVILASSVAGTRFRRVREVVILKTLGATRRRVAGI
ncbi:MAG: ABC transporter permease, partial [Bryobacteraceae bacterium]